MAEASRWYETHRAGLGSGFLEAVDTAVARIAEIPRMGLLVSGVSGPDDPPETPAALPLSMNRGVARHLDESAETKGRGVDTP